jgi:hypothetical protein
MTVHKCQALAIAGCWINPKVGRLAIIVSSVGFDRPLRYAAQNVLMPLLGFYDDSLRGDNESDLKTISIG